MSVNSSAMLSDGCPETDAARRKDLGGNIAFLKEAAGHQPALQQLRARESELVNSLQSEQATLRELNEQFECVRSPARRSGTQKCLKLHEQEPLGQS